MKPLEALEAFWQKITVAAPFLPPPLRPYASAFGNPNFFLPRLDYYAFPSWTNIYETEPLRQTLSQLVDLTALADPNALPGLLVSATDVEAGQIAYFYSRDDGLSLDHIVASGSLPPSFPMTVIGGKFFWDGGLFDNTPLGAVLDKLDSAIDADRTIYVVNLFPNKAPLPLNLQEVTVRTQNLQFVNRTLKDLKMMGRIDGVVALMEALESLPEGNPLKDHPAYQAVAKRRYMAVPKIIAITRPEQVEGFGGSDFSPEAIKQRERRLQTDRKGAATSVEEIFRQSCCPAALFFDPGQNCVPCHPASRATPSGQLPALADWQSAGISGTGQYDHDDVRATTKRGSFHLSDR